MTLDELFPREKFPLRAKTEIPLDGKPGAIRRVKIFYQSPFLPIDEQESIVVTSVIVNGKEVFAFSVDLTTGEETKSYNFDGENIVAICDEDAERLVEKEGLATFFSDNPDPETLKWEQF